ncbi:unnamed protein product [Lathyrus sativus]|nr:unnamed protein product [Lathyrus sativus]
MSSRNKKVSIYVSDDIVLSILSKLPLKSVNRFTCVHKCWSLLFENSCFVNMFYKNMVSKYQSLGDEEKCLLTNYFDSTNWQWKLHVLSLETFESKMQLNFPHPFKPDLYRSPSPSTLVSYADGVLCIYDRYHSDIALWNHVTAELNIIPRSIAIRKEGSGMHEEFRFYKEFHINTIIHGFGYDQIKDDYKIIQYVKGRGCWEDRLPYPLWEIYSLKRKFWKRLYLDDMPTRSGMCDPLSFNGVCHWCGYIRDETYVVSFYFNTETHVTTPLPKNMQDLDCSEIYLILLNGYVAMISSYVLEDRVSIAILTELGVMESWIKLFDFIPSSNMYYPIGASKNGDLLYKHKDQLISVDLTTGIVLNIDLNKDIKDVLGEKESRSNMLVY